MFINNFINYLYVESLSSLRVFHIQSILSILFLRVSFNISGKLIRAYPPEALSSACKYEYHDPNVSYWPFLHVFILSLSVYFLLFSFFFKLYFSVCWIRLFWYSIFRAYDNFIYKFGSFPYIKFFLPFMYFFSYFSIIH